MNTTPYRRAVLWRNVADMGSASLLDRSRHTWCLDLPLLHQSPADLCDGVRNIQADYR